MPANGFNVGSDVTLDIRTGRGTLRARIRTGFTKKQMTKDLESEGADGVNRYAYLPAGWEGSMDYDRGNSEIDDLFAQREADYYGGLDTDEVTITETIQEVGGGLSQYRYTGVCLKLDDGGDSGGQKLIKQKVGFKASRRIKVA
jgi:hypothetical protein